MNNKSDKMGRYNEVLHAENTDSAEDLDWEITLLLFEYHRNRSFLVTSPHLGVQRRT